MAWTQFATYLKLDNRNNFGHAIITLGVRVRPILARAVIADGQYRPHFADKSLNKRVKRTWQQWEDFIKEEWIGPSDVLVLGDVLPGINLPLGWKGGLAGMRHVFLDDLRSASQLKGIATAKI